MDRPEQQLSAQEIAAIQLEESLRKIRLNCSGADGTGIPFFRNDAEAAGIQPNERKLAETVYDSLLLTLQTIGETAVEKAKAESAGGGDYRNVAEALVPMTHVCRLLAENSIPFNRKTDAEQKRRALGDTVYVYGSGAFEADQTAYDNMRVFIRPQRFRQSLQSASNTRRDIQVAETAEPRMLITIKPRDSKLGEISLRVDKGDIQDHLQVMYDVMVGLNDENIIDTLDFGTETGQVAGHHFSSGVTTGDFGCTIDRLYEAFNGKLAANISSTEHALQ